ncbi:GntR family transcriptional regulator [Streptomyces sp. NBC_00879]|uniref:FadR/GntR family transcriptional regulator n=1 Tax=Streptomyces sp. NBC_00879 TaxID=2975855 RepID=UPI0038635ADC|nr:GntR family transcriptional regulator [Streptomyces sp. NBC_00879]
MGESHAYGAGRVDWAGEAMLQPVRSTNAFEEVMERLMQAIKLGVLEHGERLPPERELATRLAVSRVTLREAISALRGAGFVESRRGRHGGTFVTYQMPNEPDERNLRRAAEEMGGELADLLTYRMALETGAAQTAAQRDLSSAQRAYLQRRLVETETADPDQFRRADSRLHLAIAELTGSGSLTMSIAQTRMRLNELLDAIPILDLNIEHSHTQHRRIVQAILAGDPAAARSATEEHLEATASLLRGFLS